MNVIVPAITAILGIIIGNFLNQKRDSKNKKKDIRITYLIEAYRRLERGSAPHAKFFNQSEFESAIADIQMLGNVDQVKIAFKFAKDASENSNANLQPLLENLRGELRNELSIINKDLPKIAPFRMK